MFSVHLSPRFRQSLRRRPRRGPSDRWTCTDDPGRDARTCRCGRPPTDADAPAEAPVAGPSTADEAEAAALFDEEPVAVTLDAWLETSAPSPEEYHTIELRRAFYAAPCRLGQLGGADGGGLVLSEPHEPARLAQRSLAIGMLIWIGGILAALMVVATSL